MPTTVQPAPDPSVVPAPLTLQELERPVAASPAVARAVVVGLPALGFLASLFVGLPPFAALMSACFLLGAALTCGRAVAAFAGRTLRLLVAARVVVVAVLGALLFVSNGSTWTGIVSAVLLWLAADRLLGRRALFDLWRLTRKGGPSP